VMTKTTLKALWLGGGGVLATWLAVTPNQGAPTSTPAATQRLEMSREPSAEDLRAQANRLRDRTGAVSLGGSTRNLFRFNAPTSAAAPHVAPAPTAAVDFAPPPVALPPPFTLNGVTGTRTPDGLKRTAVVSGDGQMYFVSEGDSLAGRYTVVKVDPEAVVLRDASGEEIRLALP
jgi:hypothetical protein